MYPSIVTGAAVLLAALPSVMAVGVATVVNNCGFDVYYKSITTSAESFKLLDGSYSEAYSNPGQGVSIKLALAASDSAPVSQFEFTWASGKINYDLSNINGYPFEAEGISVTPSMSGDPNNPSCVPINCPAGTAVCSAAYNQPNDVATLVCDQDSSLTMVLCAGGSAKRDLRMITHSHHHPEVHERHIRHPHGLVWVKV